MGIYYFLKIVMNNYISPYSLFSLAITIILHCFEGNSYFFFILRKSEKTKIPHCNYLYDYKNCFTKSFN
jgi:hypothetical protein